jgi:poly(glycerol-phosphate) alpha-glucosyltransferase
MTQDRLLRVGMLIGSTSVAGGGVPEALRMLCFALEKIPGISLEVFGLRGDDKQLLDFGTIPVHLAPVTRSLGFGYAPTLGAMIAKCQPDILHVHGLWMYLSVVARKWHKTTGKPYVVSPHGMLDPWAMRNAFWKKRLAWHAYEDAHLGNAACIHALCEAERTAVRAAGLKRPVVVLPNGIEQFQRPADLPAWRNKLPRDAKVLMFLGRLTPKKCVAELIKAWSRVCDQQPAWHLALVGPDEGGYAGHLDNLASAGQRPPRIHLVGPAYGEERSRAYATATAFILPSVSEGQPLAALEALSQGIPALLTPQCNLPEVFEAGCGLAIGTSDEEIAEGLETLFELPAEKLAAMGELGRKLVADRFNWTTIAARFADLYRHLAAPTGAHEVCGPPSVPDSRLHKRFSQLRKEITSAAPHSAHP